MSLAPQKSSAIRGASVFVLSFLLLVSPLCGAFCQAQMCDAPQAGAGKASCHESFSVAADPSTSHVNSIQNCALQQQPVALPVGFRSLAGNSPLVDHATRDNSQLAVRAGEFHHDNRLYLPFSSSAESRSLGDLPEHFSLVLRI